MIILIILPQIITPSLIKSIPIPIYSTKKHPISLLKRLASRNATSIKSNKKFNRCCYICYNFHETESLNIGKPYMVTPCKHAFHSVCLENWFKQKKECPSCRKLFEG